MLWSELSDKQKDGFIGLINEIVYGKEATEEDLNEVLSSKEED